MSDPTTKPAESSLDAKFDTQTHEPRLRERWTDSNAFRADPQRVLSGEKEPYAVVIPPPNVTDRLHLGHALDNTVQDVLVRLHRMMGHETIWIPGTDHAGIATQTRVEKALLQTEGKKRTEYDRDEFIAKVQAWKDQYEATITDQLRQMGCSCDWDRQRFTMDDVCAKAVREGFFRLFKDGLIYRGKRLVNWDPVNQTALADDEVEMKEVAGKFYYLRYPLIHPPEDPSDPASGQPVTWDELAARGYPVPTDAAHADDAKAWITVATTRPETYLGDTAVAMNPDDPRGTALDGLQIRLPLVGNDGGRVIPIIKDDYVVMADADSSDAKARYATGFLKVTPAHDKNDWAIGQRHTLEIINVMAPDASISDTHGWEDVGDAHIFVGKSREEARELVVREFEARGLLEKTRDYTHSVGHSYRSHVPIEDYLSDQWYVKVSDDSLRGEAQRALAPEQRSTETFPVNPDNKSDGLLEFFPERYAKTYEAWHDNLRDWCISRQLWWGHRIPVWHREMVIEKGDWAEAGEFGILGLDHLVKGECADIGAIRIHDEIGNEIDPFEILKRDKKHDRTFQIYVCYNEACDGHQLEELDFVRDPDVLDTWFSSALWPLSTMGWPEPAAFPDEKLDGLLDAFNPTSVLCTGRDIITLWVSRMVMFNRYFKDGDLPFVDVYIHPIIQDGQGQRMSKSLGNGVDPLDIVHAYGSDAMRFVMCQIATATQDVKLPVELVCPHTGEVFEPEFFKDDTGNLVAKPIQTCPSDASKKMVSAYGLSKGTVPTDEMPLARNTSGKFEIGRNFCTKLWNAARFTMMNLAESDHDPQQTPDFTNITLADKWMLSRLANSIDGATDALKSYQFSLYAQHMYDLLWRDFCDWYLEAIKPTIKQNAAQQSVLRATLETIIRLLHPSCPYITEVINEALLTHPRPDVHGLSLEPSTHDGLLCRAGWPVASPDLFNPQIEAQFDALRELTGAIREVRAKNNVLPRKKVVFHTDEKTAKAIAAGDGLVENLAGLEGVTTDPPPAAPAASVSFVYQGAEFALSGLMDDTDPAVERSRLQEQLSKLDKDISGLKGRLNNPGYTDKAPEKLVNQTRDQLVQKQAERDKVSTRLEDLT